MIRFQEDKVTIICVNLADGDRVSLACVGRKWKVYFMSKIKY